MRIDLAAEKGNLRFPVVVFQLIHPRISVEYRMVQLFRLNEHVIEGSGNFTDFFGTDQALMDDGPFFHGPPVAGRNGIHKIRKLFQGADQRAVEQEKK